MANDPSFPPPRASFPPPVGGPKVPGTPAPPGPGLRVVSGARPLVLPRRSSPLARAQEAGAATADARKSIDAIISQSRPPWGGAPALSGPQVDDLEKAVRALETRLAERDHALAEAESKLAERERELAEAEALLAARERVIQSAKPSSPSAAVSAEHAEALKKLREELDRREESLREQRAALKEREDFLDQSESMLFSKMQQQQEKETELEQMEEDLRRKMRQLGLLKDEPAPEIEKA